MERSTVFMIMKIMIINLILIYKCASLQHTMANNPAITQIKRNKITQINTNANKTI